MLVNILSTLQRHGLIDVAVASGEHSLRLAGHDHPCHLVGHSLITLRPDMAIDVGGCGASLVTEAFTAHLQRDPCFEGRRGIAVPEVMEPDPRHLGGDDGIDEELRHFRRMNEIGRAHV